MISMTGYGYKEYQDDKLQLSIEIKSYNNRFLDIIVKVPGFLNPIEPKIRDYLKNHVQRGRIEIYIRIKELEENLSITLDKNVLKVYVEMLNNLIIEAGLDGESIKIGHLLKMDGVLKTQKDRNIDELWNKIFPVFETAFLEYNQRRIEEGVSTKKDIEEKLVKIEKNITIIESYVEPLEAKIKHDIRERFKEMLGSNIDDTRVYAETAVLLIKYNINEEIVRLKIHTESFRKDLKQKTGTGKKLDFLCQEIGREINTIGSKSVITEVNQCVIELKDYIEQIREQLRNVE